MSDYKVKYFPGLSNGLWRNKQYPHILPFKNKYDNLLKTYKSKLIEYLIDKNIKLHICFHHLNSSQAMCLNFFYPLVKEKELGLIIEFLGFKNEIVNYDSVCFEKDGLEKVYNSRPTSFDFYFETNSYKKFYFEIKYSESEFGKAKINPEKINKFKTVYQKYLAPLRAKYHNEKEFFDNYQILRNIIHIKEDSYVVFIYPNNNKKVKMQAENVKNDMLILKYHNHFFPITWENLYSIILESVRSKDINKQFSDFKEKYFEMKK